MAQPQSGVKMSSYYHSGEMSNVSEIPVFLKLLSLRLCHVHARDSLLSHKAMGESLSMAVKATELML